MSKLFRNYRKALPNEKETNQTTFDFGKLFDSSKDDKEQSEFYNIFFENDRHTTLKKKFLKERVRDPKVEEKALPTYEELRKTPKYAIARQNFQNFLEDRRAEDEIKL